MEYNIYIYIYNPYDSDLARLVSGSDNRQYYTIIQPSSLTMNIKYGMHTLYIH